MRLPGAEPRGEDRLAAAPEVAYRLGRGEGAAFRARLLSLSWGAITALAAEPPEVETEVVFDLPLPGGGALSVAGVVSFSHGRAPGDAYGLLGAALELDDRTAAALDLYLRTVGPLPSEDPTAVEDLRATVPGFGRVFSEEAECFDEPTLEEILPDEADAPRTLREGPSEGTARGAAARPDPPPYDQTATLPGVPRFDEVEGRGEEERAPTLRLPPPLIGSEEDGYLEEVTAATKVARPTPAPGPSVLAAAEVATVGAARAERPDHTLEDSSSAALAGNPWATDELRERSGRILALPCRLGPYALLLPMGIGGMATVYLARAVATGGVTSPIAVKVVHAHLADDPYFLSAFLKEARLAAQLRHPNIAQVLELGEYDGTYFLAMEAVLGESLRAVGRRLVAGSPGYMDPRLACSLVAQVGDGLHVAHELRDESGTPVGLVHRDVTPHNVLVSYEGAAKLLDFGVARATSSTHSTAPRAMKGKFPYMAPEQVLGLGVDRRADVFSLGVVLWELLTGKRLFKGGSPVETLRLVTGARVPAVGTIRPGIPFPLDRVVARALARDPDERYGSAAELGEALAIALRPLGGLLDVHEVAASMESGFAIEAREKRGAAQRLMAMPLDLPPPPPRPSKPPPPPFELSEPPITGAIDAGGSALGLEGSTPAPLEPTPQRLAVDDSPPKVLPREEPEPASRAPRPGVLLLIVILSTLLAAALTVGLLAAMGRSPCEDPPPALARPAEPC